MRIAVSGAFLDQPDTGSGRYAIELLRQLAEDDHDRFTVLVATAAAEAVAVEIAGDALAAVDVRRLEPPGGQGNVGKVWFEQVSVPRAAEEAEAELLFVPYFGPPHRSVVPVVTTIHDLIMLVVPEHRGDWRVQAYTALARAAARRSRGVLADSEATRRDVIQEIGIDAGRVQTVYLAADPRFRPAPVAAVEAVRRRYGLGPGPAVLYLGGFDTRKDVPRLIDAFAALPGTPELWLAGRLPMPGGLFPDIRAAVAASGVSGRIRLPGFVDEADKPALYSAATVVVYPSRYEGFGLPVLEALACGAAVVSSTAASLPEVFGDAALGVPAGDTAALTGAVQRLLADPAERSRLGQLGIQRAAGFSWQRCATETREAFRIAVG